MDDTSEIDLHQTIEKEKNLFFPYQVRFEDILSRLGEFLLLVSNGIQQRNRGEILAVKTFLQMYSKIMFNNGDITGIM